MMVVFLFNDTKPLVASGYTCMWCPTMAYHSNHMSWGASNKVTKAKVHKPRQKWFLSFFTIILMVPFD